VDASAMRGREIRTNTTFSSWNLQPDGRTVVVVLYD
jgi:hypothetical protein